MPLPIAAKPEDVGIDSEKLEAVFARAQRDVDDGTLQGCQVAVARGGVLAGFRSFGKAAIQGELHPVTDDTPYVNNASTEAIVAAAVWTLFEDGLLRLDEKVAEIIPEFGTNGKEVITVEQTMLHIGGFPMAPFRAEDWDNRETRLARFAKWRLNFEPGTQFIYHATTAHWVLAEIIERRTGKEFRSFIRERILDPMGLDDFYIRLPDSENSRVAYVLHMVPPVPPPGG